MTEAEYISATDLVKVRQARNLLGEMNTDDEWINIANGALRRLQILLETQVLAAMNADLTTPPPTAPKSGKMG